MPLEISLTDDVFEQFFQEKVPSRLKEAMRYSVLAPGKRLRPKLFLMTSELLGLAQASVLPAAIALEMAHCFTLIHDDLPCMDNDDWRRGIPSNHKQFGETTALLAGDALIALAMETFCACELSASSVVSGLKRFSSAIFQVIEGQSLEFDPNQPCSALEQLEKIHQKKTGSLFEACFLIPADFLGWKIEDQKRQSLAFFGSAWGKSFQMLDDLKDASEKKNSRNHFNILHYLSEQEVLGRIEQLQEQASRKLHEVWGMRANPLLKMMHHA